MIMDMNTTLPGVSSGGGGSGTALTTSTSRPPPATVVTPSGSVTLSQREGCLIDGKFYGDGAQVPSDPSKPCDLCYCIRNHTACVMQECVLQVDGCSPVLLDAVCCPVRYNCDARNITQLPQVSSTTPLPSGTFTCQLDGQSYNDGDFVPSNNPCDYCYCMHGDIVCAVQDCAHPLEMFADNCQQMPKSDPTQCCPTFECGSTTGSGTEQPTTISSVVPPSQSPDDHETTGKPVDGGEESGGVTSSPSTSQTDATAVPSPSTDKPEEGEETDVPDAASSSTAGPSPSTEETETDAPLVVQVSTPGTTSETEEAEVETDDPVKVPDVSTASPATEYGPSSSSPISESPAQPEVTEEQTEEPETSTLVSEEVEGTTASQGVPPVPEAPTAGPSPVDPITESPEVETTPAASPASTSEETTTTGSQSTGSTPNIESEGPVVSTDAPTTDAPSGESTGSPIPDGQYSSTSDPSDTGDIIDAATTDSTILPATQPPFEMGIAVPTDATITDSPAETSDSPVVVTPVATESPATNPPMVVFPVDPEPVPTDAPETTEAQPDATAAPPPDQGSSSAAPAGPEEPSTTDEPDSADTDAPSTDDPATDVEPTTELPAVTQAPSNQNTVPSQATSTAETESPHWVTGDDVAATTVASASAIPGEGSCLHNNVTYSNGDEIPPPSPCQLSCHCESSVIRCQIVDCLEMPDHMPNCKPVFMPNKCCPVFECDDQEELPATTSATPVAPVDPTQKPEEQVTDISTGGEGSGDDSESVDSLTTETESPSDVATTPEPSVTTEEAEAIVTPETNNESSSSASPSSSTEEPGTEPPTTTVLPSSSTELPEVISESNEALLPAVTEPPATTESQPVEPSSSAAPSGETSGTTGTDATDAPPALVSETESPEVILPVSETNEAVAPAATTESSAISSGSQVSESSSSSAGPSGGEMSTEEPEVITTEIPVDIQTQPPTGSGVPTIEISPPTNAPSVPTTGDSGSTSSGSESTTPEPAESTDDGGSDSGVSSSAGPIDVSTDAPASVPDAGSASSTSAPSEVPSSTDAPVTPDAGEEVPTTDGPVAGPVESSSSSPATDAPVVTTESESAESPSTDAPVSSSSETPGEPEGSGQEEVEEGSGQEEVEEGSGSAVLPGVVEQSTEDTYPSSSAEPITTTTEIPPPGSPAPGEIVNDILFVCSKID